MMSVHAWGEIVFIIKAAVTARGCQQCAAPAAKSFSGYFVKISCQPQIKVVMEKVTLPVPQPLYLLIHCHRQSQSQMYYFIHTNNKNIARVRNSPDIARLNSLFGLRLLSFCVFDFFVFIFLSFCQNS